MCVNGHLVELSQDHKPNCPYEKERILKEGGEVIDGRVNGVLSLSRAIGDFQYKTKNPPKNASPTWFKHHHMVTAYPQITRKALTSDVEFIVIACDGVWDCRTSQ